MTTNDTIYSTLLLQLLSTNSPKKRIAILNEWLDTNSIPHITYEPVLALLEKQASDKVKQGATGGQNSAKTSTTNDLLTDILSALKNPTTKNSKSKKDTYPAPIWVAYCRANCTLCGKMIDGAGFRWKRGGAYESYHALCIPPEHTELFEAIRSKYSTTNYKQETSDDLLN